MDDQPIPDREIDQLYTLARKTGIYRDALMKQGLPESLVDQLTRDWHLSQIDDPLYYYNLTDRLIERIVKGLARGRVVG